MTTLGGPRRTGGVIAAALLALTAGCASVECAPERLPHRGVVRTTDELYELVRHLVRHECWERLYDCLSERTRDAHSYVKIRIGLKQVTVPEPYEYSFLDVLRDGEYLGALPGPGGRELALVRYQEPGRPELLAQVLVVSERDDEGREVKRLAVEEQVQDGPRFDQPVAPDDAGAPAPGR